MNSVKKYFCRNCTKYNQVVIIEDCDGMMFLCSYCMSDCVRI